MNFNPIIFTYTIFLPILIHKPTILLPINTFHYYNSSSLIPNPNIMQFLIIQSSFSKHLFIQPTFFHPTFFSSNPHPTNILPSYLLLIKPLSNQHSSILPSSHQTLIQPTFFHPTFFSSNPHPTIRQLSNASSLNPFSSNPYQTTATLNPYSSNPYQPSFIKSFFILQFRFSSKTIY